MRMVRALIAFLVFLPLACCAGPTRQVVFVVTDSGGAGIAGARVHATVLGRSPTPLPLSFETMEEVLTKEISGGVTGDDGTVTLTLDDDQAHHVDVSPPLFGPGSREGQTPAWRFLLLPDNTLTLDPSAIGSAPWLFVETRRP